MRWGILCLGSRTRAESKLDTSTERAPLVAQDNIKLNSTAVIACGSYPNEPTDTEVYFVMFNVCLTRERGSTLRILAHLPFALHTGAYDIQCQADCAEARRKYQNAFVCASVNWVLFQPGCGETPSNVTKNRPPRGENPRVPSSFSRWHAFKTRNPGTGPWFEVSAEIGGDW